ncbi:hypothetical protein FXO38_01946 [Capsicum annuum]|nr:hypothetical protein FXO38_01946 [Capsicum annuum]
METASLNDHNNTSHSFETIKLRMKFDLDEDEFNYYNEYAATIDFSVRKEYANKSKAHRYITSRKFACYKEGILCGHALKILDTLNVKDKIFDHYIVKRWTKDATNLMAMDIKGSMGGSDPKAEVLGDENILPWQSSEFNQVSSYESLSQLLRVALPYKSDIPRAI